MARPSTSSQSQQPYRLHRLMLDHKLPQGELRRRLRYVRGPNAGTPIAASTMSQLLLRRRWVSALDKDDVTETVARFLREQGLPENDIATVWDIDNERREPDPPKRSRRHADAADATDPEDEFHAPEPEMLSQEAREHFRITRSPFIDDVQGPEDLFLSRDQRYVRESMYQAAMHAGLIAIVGESGSGKSTLRRDLIDRIRRDNQPLIIIQAQTVDKERLTAQHICDALIADLSNEAPKLSLEAKARQVQRLLANSSKSGNQHVLLIEEAHDLTTKTLKILKRFWEMEDGFRKLLGIVLVGQPELLALLDERKNYDLREFIRRCEVAKLRPLDAHLADYVALKFKRVGMDAADVIEPQTYEAIRARLVRKNTYTRELESQCYPLIVQNLLIKCMNQAAELGLQHVNADLVGRV